MPDLVLSFFFFFFTLDWLIELMILEALQGLRYLLFIEASSVDLGGGVVLQGRSEERV
jgi:hypothetical protein